MDSVASGLGGRAVTATASTAASHHRHAQQQQQGQGQQQHYLSESAVGHSHLSSSWLASGSVGDGVAFLDGETAEGWRLRYARLSHEAARKTRDLVAQVSNLLSGA
jgi:hypothetical protein